MRLDDTDIHELVLWWATRMRARITAANRHLNA